MNSLFKSEQKKKEIIRLYERKLNELDINFEYLRINTQFGDTNIIVVGDSSKPPIFIFHGSNACAPIAIETYPNLKENYQVFAVDLLAQPNKSAETRLSMKDNSYGIWVNEIITELNLEQVTLAGFSLGGLVILKTLIYNETKIKEAFLSAPAFIVNGNPLTAIFKIFMPMKLYMKTQNIKHLKKFLSALFTSPDSFAMEFLSNVIPGFNMDFTPIPIISISEAKSIKTPISIFAGQKDIMFPGRKMIKRASKIFPSLHESFLFENAKHVFNEKDNKRVEDFILKRNNPLT